MVASWTEINRPFRKEIWWVTKFFTPSLLSTTKQICACSSPLVPSVTTYCKMLSFHSGLTQNPLKANTKLSGLQWLWLGPWLLIIHFPFFLACCCCLLIPFMLVHGVFVSLGSCYWLFSFVIKEMWRMFRAVGLFVDRAWGLCPRNFSGFLSHNGFCSRKLHQSCFFHRGHLKT